MYSGDYYNHHDDGYVPYRGHRGGRGRRGQRRGLSGYRYSNRQYRARWDQGENDSTEDNKDGARSESDRRPKHLRGKAIGLWHAFKGARKKAAQERAGRSTISMENAMEVRLAHLIEDIKGRRSGETEVKAETDQETDFATEESADFLDYGDLDHDPQSEMQQYLGYTTQSSDSGQEAQQKGINAMLSEEHEYSQQNPKYKKMMEFREMLPCYKEKQNILDLINSNQVVVLSGETGCGKTTQVPQYILDHYLEQERGAMCNIICTQPRRISAISVAERVADERAERCGMSVGYMIRLENKLPRERGSILYCTTGIVLKMLENDPYLQRATHVILDEIHERDLLSDFLIIILKDLIQRRPDLKVVLMSATLNAEQFSQYYGNCPMIHVPGFTFPVEEYLLEDVVETLQYEVPEDMQKRAPRRRYGKNRQTEDSEQEYALHVWLRNLQAEGRYSGRTLDALEVMDMKKVDTHLIKDLVKYISANKPAGAILVFVPGWMEISSIHKNLVSDTFFEPSKYKIIPLHSMMPTLNQRDVFNRPPEGVRKIVIATNIAETSITIDDVVYVVDCGKIKVTYFTPESNLMSLEPRLVSQANSKQRRGRAGRVQPGECYHLYSGLQESFMEPYLPPEILRTRLEELCLNIKLLKLGRIVPFVSKAIQTPSIAALTSAIQNLQDLNALDKQENLLPLGKHLAKMPLDPHTGKMILFGAMFGCLDPILTIAAALNFKDPFYLPLGKEREADAAKKKLADGCNSDHILLVKAFQAWLDACEGGYNQSFCYDHFLSESTLRMLQKMKDQLFQHLKDLGFLKGMTMDAANANSDNMALVKAIVCAGLYPNVAKIPIRKRLMLYTRSDGKCDLHPKSVASGIQTGMGIQWTVYHQKMKTACVYIYDLSVVSPFALMLFGGEMSHIEEEGDSLVCIDEWIKFKASPATIQLFQDLREEINLILDRKITKSSSTFWNPASQEHSLLEAIIELITTEHDESEANPRPDSHQRKHQW